MRTGYQDAFAEGLMRPDELRAALERLEDKRRELGAIPQKRDALRQVIEYAVPWGRTGMDLRLLV